MIERREAKALSGLFHRRGTGPILAFLHRRGGTPFGAISSHVPGSRGALRAAVGALITDGWVERVTGHAHPLQPELSLTPPGRRLAATVHDLLEAFERLAGELPRKKWTFPVLALLDSDGARFGQLREALPDITDRALSAVLKYLEERGCVERSIGEGWPSAVLYRPAARARRLARDVDAVVGALLTPELACD
jgi:DNA-binding HxlR family transcriptional regulator